MLTPTPSSALAGWDVSNPTVGIPAATAAVAPAGLSSNATHLLASPAPTRRMPSRYGSGHGLALAHSVPITTCSKYVSSPSARSMSSAFGRGALVTATFRTPLESIHARSSVRPGSLSSLDAASVRKSSSFFSHIASRSGTDSSGHRSAKMSSLVRPAMCSWKNSLSMGTPPFLPCASRRLENTSWWSGSVSHSVPSMSNRHA